MAAYVLLAVIVMVVYAQAVPEPLYNFGMNRRNWPRPPFDYMDFMPSFPTFPSKFPNMDNFPNFDNTFDFTNNNGGNFATFGSFSSIQGTDGATQTFHSGSVGGSNQGISRVIITGSDGVTRVKETTYVDGKKTEREYTIPPKGSKDSE